VAVEVVDLEVAVTAVAMVDLVVEVALEVAVSKVPGFMVGDTLQAELAAAEAEWALAACAPELVFRTLRVQDLAFLRLGVHRTHRLSRMLLANKRRVQQSQGNRVRASPTFAITLWRGMMQTGTTTGTGGMPTLTMVASLSS